MLSFSFIVSLEKNHFFFMGSDPNVPDPNVPKNRGRGKLKGDAMIAMISTAALAVGVIALSLSNGTTGDVNNYLFGSVLAMSERDGMASEQSTAAFLSSAFSA